MQKKKIKAPQIDKQQKRLDFIRRLKEMGVVGYNETSAEEWSVAFVPSDKESASVIGFAAQENDVEDDSGLLNPARLAAAQARRELFAAPVTGVAPEVIAEVEAAAAKFEFESGLVDPRVVALAKRAETAKTTEEREHYEKLLSQARNENLAYAHN